VVTGVSEQWAKAVGGSCLGSVLGAVLGAVVGVVVSGLVSEDHQPKDLVSGIASIIGEIFGPVSFGTVGAAIGAIGGSVLGAALATFLRGRWPPPQGAGPPVPGGESTGTELARGAAGTAIGEDTGAPSGVESLPFDERLRRLEQLKGEGLLSEEEYRRKRAELLNEQC
jgi:hypothetical protein